MNQEHIWALYYMTIMGWQYHPGYKKDEKARQIDIGQAAEVADTMLLEHNRRWGQCPTGAQ